MVKIRICKRCGAKIGDGHPEANYCDICRAQVHVEAWDALKVERERKQAEKHERERLEKEERDKRKYKGPSIADINRRAEELGISYGKYVSKYGSVIV